MTPDLWTWPLVGALFVGLFLAVAVAFRPGDRAARIGLSVLFLTAASFAGEFAAMRWGLYRPPILFVTYPTFFLIGPAAWFVTRALAGETLRMRSVFPHLIPAAAAAIDFLPYYAGLLSAGTPSPAIPSPDARPTGTLSGLGPYPQCLIQLAHSGIYVALAVGTLRLVSRRLRAEHSGGVVLRLDWARRLAIVLGVTIGLELLAAFTMLTSGRHVVAAEYVMGFAFSALVLALGWMLLQEPAVLEEPVVAAPKYERSALDPGKLSTLARRLVEVMETHELWRNPDLRLADVSEATGVPRQHVSQVLSRAFRRSFFEFVNAFRVREAARQLLSEEGRDKILLAVAFDSGFSSKASFNRVFKDALGVTPSGFRRAGSLDDPAIRLPEPIDVGAWPTG